MDPGRWRGHADRRTLARQPAVHARHARRQRHRPSNSARPTGARATLYVQGRYGVELDGTGDWQRVALRFRAPRFDAGFNKIANAFMLDVRDGTDFRRNVVFEGPARARAGTARTSADPSSSS